MRTRGQVGASEFYMRLMTTCQVSYYTQILGEIDQQSNSGSGCFLKKSSSRLDSFCKIKVQRAIGHLRLAQDSFDLSLKIICVCVCVNIRADAYIIDQQLCVWVKVCARVCMCV